MRVNAITSNFQLEELLARKGIKLSFCGLSSDFDPYTKGISIVNLSRTSPGTHWVGFYSNSDKVGYYFDSFGIYPMKSMEEAFSGKNRVLHYSEQCLQATATQACGPWVCAWIIFMNKHKWSPRSYETFLKLFSDPERKSDINLEILEKIVGKVPPRRR